jgi:hypothetical protein
LPSGESDVQGAVRHYLRHYLRHLAAFTNPSRRYSRDIFLRLSIVIPPVFHQILYFQYHHDTNIDDLVSDG